MTGEELIQGLIQLSPFYRSQNGERYCFFCKAYQLEELVERHEPDCLFVAARRLTQAEAGASKDPTH